MVLLHQMDIFEINYVRSPKRFFLWSFSIIGGNLESTLINKVSIKAPIGGRLLPCRLDIGRFSCAKIS